MSAPMTLEERARLRQRVREGGLFSYEAYALLDALDASEAERARYQREHAELSDRLNGTPCAEIRWEHDREALVAQRDSARALLREVMERLRSSSPLRARIKAELGE